MPINPSFKQSVRKFAALNEVTYTTALREFGSVGDPRYRERSPRAWEDQVAAEKAWAGERGLSTARTSGGCFHQLSNASGRVGSMHYFESLRQSCGSVGKERFKDHPREWSYRGPNDKSRRLAVMSFAPYQPWDSERLAEEIDAQAREFDLRVRVGFSADVTYGGNTVPVVFWNPRVIDLG